MADVVHVDECLVDFEIVVCVVDVIDEAVWVEWF